MRSTGGSAVSLLITDPISILLFNDRFGINRIYIHESREAITFASEAKAILCVRPETRTLDPQALGHFLGFGAVFDNRTLFAGVSLMPGGACWSLSRPSVAAVKKFQYFHPSTWESQPLLDPATFYRRSGTPPREYFRRISAPGRRWGFL